ncbi:MAG: AAA family ATPase [Planctomycetes bacterium]|nr:AAA family ATPase [Planctomycetota bacterium]
MTTPPDVEQRLRQFAQDYRRIAAEVRRVIVGHEDVLEGVLLCLLTDGHALLEGVPGIGKTLLVRTLAEALDLEFRRIQFTPDLMPADIVGTNVITEAAEGRREWEFRPGPIFGNLILADEINRATPKTQSALLEAMQERSVTVAGTTRRLTEPFLVLATQNPLEMEGTYPLPEAQLDRFLLKLLMRMPGREEISEIVARTTGRQAPRAGRAADAAAVLSMRGLVREVPAASHVRGYAADLVLATHPERPESPPLVRKFVRYGASPRAAQAMVLGGKALALAAGRYNVAFEDLRRMARPALRHRLILNFEAEAEKIDPDAIVGGVLEHVPEPGT